MVLVCSSTCSAVSAVTINGHCELFCLCSFLYMLADLQRNWRQLHLMKVHSFRMPYSQTSVILLWRLIEIGAFLLSALVNFVTCVYF